MNITNFYFIVILGLILLIHVDGRRGGGGRGGGSRGSSSRGSSSRGSSSRGSSSRTSQSQSSRENYERKTSKDSGSDSAPKVSNPAPKPANEPTQVRPSAPELKETRPSAPNLPNQNNQPAYNPNYKPDSAGNARVNQQPPPYPVGNNNPNLGQPPPYPGGNSNPNLGQPPPYPGGSGQNLGVPPPYPGPPQRPPPYSPSATGVGANAAPYPRQPGSVQSQPQPGTGYQPYPGQTGSGYPQQPGTGYQPYPRQPGYPQQPGGYGSGYAAPPYVQNSGFPLGGASNAKPYKKQGLIGQIFSGFGSKKHKPNKYGGGYGGYGGGYGGYGGGYGGYGGMSHGSSMGIPKAMYPMMPLMMKAKKPSFFSPGFRRPSFFFIPFFMPFHSPFHSHGHYYRDYYSDIESENYRGRCIKPYKPDNSTMDCHTTQQGVTCKLSCNEGYYFEGNDTSKEAKCWHTAGVWRPSRSLPQCLPSCGDKCLNGGKCAAPGLCACDAEFRGDRCEHHVLKCDIRKVAGDNIHNISWTCHHTRNKTVCYVRCRFGHFSNEPQTRKYHCEITGEWTPEVLPECISGNSTVTSAEGTTASSTEATSTPLSGSTPAVT